MEATRDLAELGAEVAGTAADAARRAAIVFTMVTDADAVFGRPGPGDARCYGSGHDLGPDEHIGVAGTDRVTAMAGDERPDVMLLDAPVSGSKDPAERGQLTIFASGPGEARRVCNSALRRARPAHDLGRRGRGRDAAEASEQHLARR